MSGFRQSGGSLEVAESGFGLPIYDNGTVTYGMTTATYTFLNGAEQVATVILTYDGDPTDSASNLIAFEKTVP